MLERCGHLLIGIRGDALGVRHRLVVQHQELLLRVVLPAGERLFELQHACVHLAHIALSVRTHVGRLAGDHRTQRGRALLGLGAHRRGLLLGLNDLLGRVCRLALETRLVRRQLGVDPQPHLVGVLLRLRGHAGDVGGELRALPLRLLAGRLQQTLGLGRRVVDQHARLLLSHPQHGLELLPALRLVDAVAVFVALVAGCGQFGAERRDLLGRLVGAGPGRGELVFETRHPGIALGEGVGQRLLAVTAQGRQLAAVTRIHAVAVGGQPRDLIAQGRDRRIDLGLVVPAERLRERRVLALGCCGEQLIEEVAVRLRCAGLMRVAQGKSPF